jgi:hypothetical protein
MARTKPRARRDPVLYARYAARHNYCQACGIPCVQAVRQRWPGLSRHHLVKAGRSDEDCNLLVLCQRCHDLAEGLRIRVAGALLPNLPLAVCLAIKQVRDPAAFDAVRLAVLRGRPLPDPLPIPAFIETEYRQWRPTDRTRFAVRLS